MWTLSSVPPPIYSFLQVNLTFLHFPPQEALQRELVLKQKMVILQDLLSTLIRASDSSWKVREWNLCLNKAHGLLWVPISFFFPHHPSKIRGFLTTEEARWGGWGVLRSKGQRYYIHGRAQLNPRSLAGVMLLHTQGRPRTKIGKNSHFLICWKKRRKIPIQLLLLTVVNVNYFYMGFTPILMPSHHAPTIQLRHQCQSEIGP